MSGVCVCMQASTCKCMCLLCRTPLLMGQVSHSACASAAVALCASVLFTSWLGGSGQGGDAMCGLLSSLYRNDRPCCFTCCDERSVALSLHRLSKTRTQVLPIKITWVSPYVLRPSTKQQTCPRGITGTTNLLY